MARCVWFDNPFLPRPSAEPRQSGRDSRSCSVARWERGKGSIFQQFPNQIVCSRLVDIEGDLRPLQQNRHHFQAEAARDDASHPLQGEPPQQVNADQVGKTDLRTENQGSSDGALAGAVEAVEAGTKGGREEEFGAKEIVIKGRW
jgi:hypothetical protein